MKEPLTERTEVTSKQGKSSGKRERCRLNYVYKYKLITGRK